MRSAIPHAQPPALAAADLHCHYLRAVAEQRDTAAFIALFSHFAPRLKAFMKSRGASDEIAEELTQEAMFIVWRKAASYDPALSAVSSWIFTIARNLRIDTLRRDRRHLLDPADPMLAPAAPRPPDEEIDAIEQPLRVYAALPVLPPEQLVVVMFAFFLGQSHGEIAAVLGLPLGTVKSRLRLAFLRLRTALAEAPLGAAA